MHTHGRIYPFRTAVLPRARISRPPHSLGVCQSIHQSTKRTSFGIPTPAMALVETVPHMAQFPLFGRPPIRMSPQFALPGANYVLPFPISRVSKFSRVATTLLSHILAHKPPWPTSYNPSSPNSHMVHAQRSLGAPYWAVYHFASRMRPFLGAPHIFQFGPFSVTSGGGAKTFNRYSDDHAFPRLVESTIFRRAPGGCIRPVSIAEKRVSTLAKVPVRERPQRGLVPRRVLCTYSSLVDFALEKTRGTLWALWGRYLWYWATREVLLGASDGD